MKNLISLLLICTNSFIIAQNPVMEFGTVEVPDLWFTVVTNNTFIDPVVIAMPPTARESDPVSVRIRDVTANIFQIRIIEPTTFNASHIDEGVHFMVVEKGRHIFPDGTIVEAGVVSVPDQNPIDVSFNDSFNGTPILFTQVQSNNTFSGYMRSRASIQTDSLFTVRVEKETTAPPIFLPEDVAYVAISEGSGSLDGLDYEARRVDHINHVGRVVGFAGDFNQDIHCIAAMQTDIGTEPCGLRFANLTNQFMNIFAQEDDQGPHTFEEVGYLLINDNNGAAILDPGRPQITAVSPLTGPNIGGILIKIEGLNFGPPDANFEFTGQVLFDGVAIPNNEIIYVDNQVLRFRLPEGVGANKSIEVQVNGQSVTAPMTFSYEAPKIVSANPNSGSTLGGDSITVLGTSFGLVKSDLSVSLGGIPTPIGSYSPTQFRIGTPGGIGKNKDLIVQVAGTGDTLADFFSYFPPQIVSAPTSSNTIITAVASIFGSGFGSVQDSVEVFLDTLSIAITSLVSDGQIDILIPPGVGGSKTWRVRVGGQTAIGPNPFSYVPPQFFQLIPQVGSTQGGYPLVINGNELGLVQDSVEVFLGGQLATFQSFSPAQLVVDCPPGIGTDLTLQIDVGNQSVLVPNAFSYFPPSVTNVVPNSAPIIGGDILNIQGQNFGNDPASVIVQLDGIVLTLIDVQHNSIQAILPPGTGANKTISVQVSGQGTSLPNAFSYEGPSISGLSNNCLTEGDTVKIFGQNFPNPPSTQVLVNSQVANLVAQSTNEISFEVPGGLVASNNVSVSGDGQSSSIVMLPTCITEMVKMENANFLVNTNSGGIIFKTINGSCWKFFVNELGLLKTESVPCPN